MQFIAERRIENGLQIVTPIFPNPPNCLYTKKDCNFFQSYEKSHEKALDKTEKVSVEVKV